jgi:hypothetical protein
MMIDVAGAAGGSLARAATSATVSAHWWSGLFGRRSHTRNLDRDALSQPYCVITALAAQVAPDEFEGDRHVPASRNAGSGNLPTI